MERTLCSVYSRVTGYIVPVNQWNPGKSAEFEDRKMFDVSEFIDSNNNN